MEVKKSASTELIREFAFTPSRLGCYPFSEVSILKVSK